MDITDNKTGEHIATVTVLGIKNGGQIRLGFEAGDNVKFLRDNAKDPGHAHRR